MLPKRFRPMSGYLAVSAACFAVLMSLQAAAHLHAAKGGNKRPSIADVIAATNGYRLAETARDGVYRPALVPNAKLQACAQFWADAMKSGKFFAHAWEGYPRFSERLAMFEYEGRATENLARLSPGRNPADAFAARPATGHYDAMTRPQWEEIGVAYSTFRGDLLWCLVYGDPAI